MRYQLRLFLTAMQFFTRIPVPGWVGYSTAQLEQSARYFPLVGLLVGLIAAIILWLGTLIFAISVAIVLSMLGSILITGAFHEDGLSDFVDGIGGGYTREKMLAIMKDSHVGAYGVIAISLSLLIKFQVLLSLANHHSLAFVATALVAAHGVSRWIAVSIMMTQQYVREDDSARARPVAHKLGKTGFAIASGTAVVAIALLFLAGASVAKLMVTFALLFMLRVYLGRLLQKKLGGYTGDSLGAVQQITEIGFYLGLLAAW